MLQTYFQLQRRPFASVPSPEDYYPASSIEAARTSLVRLIDRQEGAGLVIGSIGIGKSLLCQLLDESFCHLCRVVNLPSGRLSSRKTLLQVILYELGLPYRDQDEGELRLSVIDHITNEDLCPNGALLLVDEADNLSLGLLDELRSLMNLTSDGRPCLRLVLFGTSRLEEKLTHPRLESFNQRIAGRYYLEPFRQNETREYLQQQFKASGGDPTKVFSNDAAKTIHQATGGIPRLINQLTDHALVLAAAGDYASVDAACVEEAWSDLQQLPTPTNRQSYHVTSDLPSDIVEFGSLDGATTSSDEDLESRFTEIEETIVQIDEGESMAIADHNTPSRPKPEVTLVFHPTHDPFGDGFEAEELVIDEFVSPDAIAQRHRRQVTTATSQELAEQLEASIRWSQKSGDGPHLHVQSERPKTEHPSHRQREDQPPGEVRDIGIEAGMLEEPESLDTLERVEKLETLEESRVATENCEVAGADSLPGDDEWVGPELPRPVTSPTDHLAPPVVDGRDAMPSDPAGTGDHGLTFQLGPSGDYPTLGGYPGFPLALHHDSAHQFFLGDETELPNEPTDDIDADISNPLPADEAPGDDGPIDLGSGEFIAVGTSPVDEEDGPAPTSDPAWQPDSNSHDFVAPEHPAPVANPVNRTESEHSIKAGAAEPRPAARDYRRLFTRLRRPDRSADHGTDPATAAQSSYEPHCQNRASRGRRVPALKPSLNW